MNHYFLRAIALSFCGATDIKQNPLYIHGENARKPSDNACVVSGLSKWHLYEAVFVQRQYLSCYDVILWIWD